MRTFKDFDNTNRLQTEAAANPVIPASLPDDFLKTENEMEAEFLYDVNKTPALKVFPSFKKKGGRPNDPARLLKQLEATASLEENY